MKEKQKPKGKSLKIKPNKIGGHNQMYHAFTDWLFENKIMPDQLDEDHKSEFTAFYYPKLRPDSGENDHRKFATTLNELYHKVKRGELAISGKETEAFTIYNSKKNSTELTDKGKEWLKDHLFTVMNADGKTNDFVFVYQNEATHFLSINSVGSPVLHNAMKKADFRWGISSSIFKKLIRYDVYEDFDTDKIIIDDDDTIYIHYLNGSVIINKSGFKLVGRTKVKWLVWRKNILKRNFVFTKRKVRLNVLQTTLLIRNR